MHTVTIGNVQVTPLLDTGLLMDPHQFMPKFAEQLLAEYSHTANDQGLMPMSITCYLVRSEGKNILIDTGLGNRRRPGFPLGHLDEALAVAGLNPGDIDVVLNTHLHIDHVGWNTVDRDDGRREVFFPNAKFVFQQTEWDFWMTEAHLAQPANAHLVECVEPLRNSGRITFFEGEKALDTNITFISTPGHTPGHVSIGIMSAGERAVVVGDASHHPAQLIHPDWSPGFDTDPLLSARTRDALFERTISEDRTWFAGHWDFPGIGKLARLDGKRVFRAL